MGRSIKELLQVAADERDETWLEESLQNAMALEFSTIPVYLTAPWSIKNPPTYPRTGLPGDILLNLPVSLAGLTPERVENLFMANEYPEDFPAAIAATGCQRVLRCGRRREGFTAGTRAWRAVPNGCTGDGPGGSPCLRGGP